MDPMQISCAYCGATLTVPQSLVGKPVQCPNCQSLLSAPGQNTAVEQTGSDQPAADQLVEIQPVLIRPVLVQPVPMQQTPMQQTPMLLQQVPQPAFAQHNERKPSAQSSRLAIVIGVSAAALAVLIVTVGVVLFRHIDRLEKKVAVTDSNENADQKAAAGAERLLVLEKSSVLKKPAIGNQASNEPNGTSPSSAANRKNLTDVKPKPKRSIEFKAKSEPPAKTKSEPPAKTNKTGPSSTTDSSEKTTDPTSVRSLESDGNGIQVLAVGGKSIGLQNDEPLTKLAADPFTTAVNFQPFVRSLEQVSAYARVSRPILIDPKGPVIAVSLHRAGRSYGRRTNQVKFGKIYLASKGDRTARLVLDIAAPLLLLDHHIKSGRSLAMVGVNHPSDRGGDITLLEGLAAGQPKVVARWRIPGFDRPGFKPKVEFGRLLDANRAVIQINRAVYVSDLVNGKSEIQIERTRASAKIQLSGTGRYLAIPCSAGCRIVDLTKGELMGKIPFPRSLTPQVRFSPDGSKLAMTAGSQFRVYDFTKGNIVGEATLGQSTGSLLGWIGNEYLLTQLSGLIDIQLGLTVWRYYLSYRKVLPLGSGVAVVNKSGTAMVFTVPIPHAAVAGMKKRLTGADSEMMAVRPGTELSLRIEASADAPKDEIKAAVLKAVKQAGWKIVEDAPIEVVVKVKRGKERKLHYSSVGARFRSSSTPVTLKPFESSISVQKGSQVYWSRRSMNMVPPLIELKKGESVQQAVERYEKFSAGSYDFLLLPPKILKPEISKLIGRSSIRNGVWQDVRAK